MFKCKNPFKLLVKFMRVFSPLKLKNTSYLHCRVKEEEEYAFLVRKAIVIWIDIRLDDLKGREERYM